MAYFSLSSIYFFIWGVCDLLDLKPFRNERSKKLPSEKRKQFRRMESITQFLMVVLLLSIAAVEHVFGIELSWPMALLYYGIPAALIIAYAVYIEKVYFEKLST